jgi:hypothetical protein
MCAVTLEVIIKHRRELWPRWLPYIALWNVVIFAIIHLSINSACGTCAKDGSEYKSDNQLLEHDTLLLLKWHMNIIQEKIIFVF